MKELEEIRKEIDRVDKNITELFEERMKLVIKVAEYKKENNVPIIDSKREKNVIEKNIKYLKDDRYSEVLEEFYINLMELSKKLEKKQIYSKKNENLSTSIYGLIGGKLGHSYSPYIHKLIMEKVSLNGIYNLFELPEKKVKGALETFKVINCGGLNVTIPYKVNVMEDLNDISDEARKIGAVNTIRFSQNGMSGFNTDYIGFGEMLKKFKVEIKDKICVVLGSGGAAKAVVQYLKDNFARKIYIVSRNVQRASKDYDECIISYHELLKINGDVIINCTPVGMYPKIDASPVSKEVVSKFSSAVDLIYNPIETLFLKYANNSGIKAVNGLYMLVSQAVASQEIWNDISIGEDIVDEIYDELEAKIKS
ncbi:shikimate dehydrogenase [Clostridium felsineum]|uniref:shikimate dehydrogenase n=1 Tax=Clostridium felsineum TaxID=36839 RepID=UPI00098C1A0F|nr:shikimate dehydrogenase [Clostridium felsineum]URZ01461.1 Shikimate dehydrogenase (NADP(+)) [Clostridium felsineum]